MGDDTQDSNINKCNKDKIYHQHVRATEIGVRITEDKPSMCGNKIEYRNILTLDPNLNKCDRDRSSV